MVGEDGGAVYKNIVFAALASFERKGVLMLQVVFLAQRAAVVENGDSPGIGLQRDKHSVDFKRAGAGAFECAVLRRNRWPYGQLVVDEFVDVDSHIRGGTGVWALSL